MGCIDMSDPIDNLERETMSQLYDEIERLNMLGKIQADRLNEALVEIERLTVQVAELEAIRDAAKHVTAPEHRGGWTDYVPGLYELRMAIANSEVEK